MDLRYVLTELIHRPPYRIWKVAELVEALTSAGFELDGRPSKEVSDVLRGEVARGRVQRVGWGQYGPGTIPGSTHRRIRKRVRRRREMLVRPRLDVPSVR